jgi:hypothetical protein
VQRTGEVITITLHCTASRTRACRTMVTATTRGRRLSQRTITFRGGSTKRVQLRLRPGAVVAAARGAIAIKITARTGSYRASRTIG